MSQITANGKPVPAQLPGTLEQFLAAQQLLPRSVVVEHNGEAVAPSESFSRFATAAVGIIITPCSIGMNVQWLSACPAR